MSLYSGTAKRKEKVNWSSKSEIKEKWRGALFIDGFLFTETFSLSTARFEFTLLIWFFGGFKIEEEIKQEFLNVFFFHVFLCQLCI